jgi:hypothetical protein
MQQDVSGNDEMSLLENESACLLAKQCLAHLGYWPSAYASGAFNRSQNAFEWETTFNSHYSHLALMSTDIWVLSYEHLKGHPRSDEALLLLQKVASRVKPIMRSHGWRLPVLAEFFPDSPNLIGTYSCQCRGGMCSTCIYRLECVRTNVC